MITQQQREEFDTMLLAPLPGRKFRADPDDELAQFMQATSGM